MYLFIVCWYESSNRVHKEVGGQLEGLGSRDQTQTSSLGGKHLYPLSRLTGPPLYFLRQTLSLNPGFTALSRQADQLAGEVLYFSLPPVLGLQVHTTTLVCGSGGSHILMLTHIAPYPSQQLFFYSITQTSINQKYELLQNGSIGNRVST